MQPVSAPTTLFNSPMIPPFFIDSQVTKSQSTGGKSVIWWSGANTRILLSALVRSTLIDDFRKGNLRDHARIHQQDGNGASHRFQGPWCAHL